MPELPEVETVRRGLAPSMEGAAFERVLARRNDLRFDLPAGFAGRLEGARVDRLARRGKYLVAPLSSGESLIMHLGMSGRFTIERDGNDARPGAFHHAPQPHAAHDHVEFFMRGPQGRARIVFNDPRRFGFMDLAPSATIERSRHFLGMGPEPLESGFTAKSLAAALKGRRTPMKAALLDQKLIAGVGNIYACEALFEAGISPRRSAATLGAGRVETLWRAIRATLTDAIAAGGSSLKDFAAADGSLGYFQHRFRVYDREGEPCPRCARPVRRIVQSGRSTFYCGGCQR
ncbi:MAG TPA: bifunctional DNA-formamidopyrimidine glycosylase/DNA-(apurinic or apyrimidinic site) lyase [Parvularculaceae bacterium]|nr:bifunctional DNA-formamidopyrimidine glycosylase/DNA-(apurinic or apyrimidinic site) lyase [Parvularculaceae bacterium]